MHCQHREHTLCFLLSRWTHEEAINQLTRSAQHAPPTSCYDNVESSFHSSSDSVHTTIWEVDVSIRVPEFLLCVSAVLETGGLLSGMGFLSFNPGFFDFFGCLHRVIWIQWLVFILRTYGWFSCLEKSTGVMSTLCSYGVKLTTSDFFLPAVIAGEIQLSKT